MSSRAIVLMHGFSGTPESVAPPAEALRLRGWHAQTPTLAGHGTRWQDLRHTSWQEWCASLDDAIDQAREASGAAQVSLLGVSVGGALSLRAAALRPDVDRVVLVNPSLGIRNPLLPLLPVLRWVVPSITNHDEGRVKDPAVEYRSYPRLPLAAVQQLTHLWRDVARLLPQVKTPVLAFRSVADGEQGEDTVRRITAGVPAPVEEVVLRRSGHIATLDHDAPLIAERTAAFLEN